MVLVQGIRDNPKLYEINAGRDPLFPPWHDTVQLNFFNPDTRLMLINEAKKIAEYCDGLRCDMAMLVLNPIFMMTWGWLAENADRQNTQQESWEEARKELPDGECTAYYG